MGSPDKGSLIMYHKLSAKWAISFFIELGECS